jgi:hypothetical protein
MHYAVAIALEWIAVRVRSFRIAPASRKFHRVAQVGERTIQH